jgi:hypothetical protein
MQAIFSNGCLNSKFLAQYLHHPLELFFGPRLHLRLNISLARPIKILGRERYPSLILWIAMPDFQRRGGRWPAHCHIVQTFFWVIRIEYRPVSRPVPAADHDAWPIEVLLPLAIVSPPR